MFLHLFVILFRGICVQGVSVKRPPDMVEKRVVRILLECILVDTKIEILSDMELKQLVLFTQSEEGIYENMKVHFQFWFWIFSHKAREPNNNTNKIQQK